MGYMRGSLFLFLVISLFQLTACGQSRQSNAGQSNRDESDKYRHFNGPQKMGVLSSSLIKEASGIAASRRYEGAIWVHNDSGNDPLLFLIDQQANVLKTFVLHGVENRDWEDIALGPGPEEGINYLYLGDIGDNLRMRDEKMIYYFPEPRYEEERTRMSDTIRSISSIRFSYPDGNFDAETLMVDPNTKDLIIVSKILDAATIYRLPSQSLENSNNTETIKLENCGNVEFTSEGLLGLITAGDIGSDGQEVIIKSYSQVFYWKKEDPSMSICELLRSTPSTLVYEAEPQGEAIAFSTDKKGYFTLSEKRFGATPVLYYYARK